MGVQTCGSTIYCHSVYQFPKEEMVRSQLALVNVTQKRNAAV